MKYRSISLNGNKGWHYSLVKYNDEYKDYLVDLRNMNKKLADSVEQCPKIYSELSEHQSYMIFQGEYRCVGAINIGTSTDERNLEIEVQLNEKYFSSQQEIVEVVEQLVESLKLYFFDEENIEINLINNIDLSKINSYKYHKRVYDEKLTTYTCTNKRNNSLIPKLVEEVSRTEKSLTDLGQSWWQSIGNHELYYDFDLELMGEIDKGTITLPELFSKVETLLWTNINSAKSSRSISFSRNGHIEFSKNSHDWENGIDYEFAYNILSNSFSLKSKSRKDSKKQSLDIDENSYFTNIKTEQLNILHSKEGKRKRINYTSHVVDNSSIAIELWTDEQDEIESCYVDFRTHKNNGKINGLYALWIAPQRYYDKFSIRFISRKGDRFRDFSEEISKNEEELFSTIVDGKLTIELIDELIRKVIPIVNNRANSYKKQSISRMNETIISNLMDSETQAINFVKQIKGEIPLPHLQENLEKFIVEHDKSKKDHKKRVLK